MTSIVVPELLTDLVENLNCLISPDRERGGLEIGESETSYLVRDTDGIYTINQISRGHLEGVVLRTNEPQAVWLYLAFVFGPEWRDRAHLADLSTPPLRQVPPGFELTKHSPSRYTLTWQDQGRQCRAENLRELNALTLAYAWPFGLEGVIASYKDPDGLPAFPQDPTRTWSR